MISRSTRLFWTAALLAAWLGAAPGCKEEAKVAAAPPAIPVNAITTAASDVHLHTEYPAIAVSVRTVMIDARVEGWLLKQRFKDGATVQANQLMYEIDPTPFRIALEKAEAELASMEAVHFDAKQKYERNKPLVATEAVSQEQFDQYEAAYLASKANVQTAKANVDNAKLNLSYCVITSPLAGQAAKTNVYEGTLVKPATNSQLTNVRQLDPIWIEFAPVAGDLPALRDLMKAGDTKVAVRDPSGTWTGQGRVVFIDNSVSQTTGTILARIEVANPNFLVMPGQYLSVALPTQSFPGAISVPEAAVVYQTAMPTVWVVGSDGAVQNKPIVLGERGGAGLIVTSGLAAGEQVITAGQQKLRPGTKVSVAPPVAAPAETPAEAKTPAAPK
ncbi:MAG: efflux RND transporter periplasmic adaptor subunit [Planctomycetes bacterium]|nr:efflux RND transporter periplasmic adaptor subunit [Planctomycetota bacterium]